MPAFASLVLSACLSLVAPQRYAIVVGANIGSDQEARLHYADSDAVRLGETLRELGGFAEGNVFVLTQPTVQDLYATFSEVQSMVRLATASGARAQDGMLLVYLAGHADPVSLHLGSRNVVWPEIIRAARQTGLGSRLLVVDACRAGGGAAADAVARVTQTEPLRGLAIFASISPDEHSRESASLGGAVFTAHFLAALRGVGDSNGDGQVSLAEALQYSAARIASDEAPVYRDAVANYRFRLDGHGTDSLTAPAQVGALAALHLAAPGTYVIRDSRANLWPAVVDVGVRTLWLPAGQYTVSRQIGRDAYAGPVVLAASAGVMLEENSLPSR